MYFFLLTDLFHSAELFWALSMPLYVSVVDPFYYCWIVFHCMNMPFVYAFLVDEHIGCFKMFNIVNRSSKAICVKVFV